MVIDNEDVAAAYASPQLDHPGNDCLQHNNRVTHASF